MLSFNNLKLQVEKILGKPIPNFKEEVKEEVKKLKINLFDKPKVKIDLAAVRLIEPGHKIHTGQFHSVSQWCDTCQDVMAFAHKPEKRRMICLTCKTLKTY